MTDDTGGDDVRRGEQVGALPFARYVECGGTIYVSGVVHRLQQQQLGKTDVQAETRCVLDKIRSLLGELGMGLEDVVKTTVYLTDMASYGDMNRGYRQAFGEVLPARSCVGVSRLPDPEAHVEIEVIARRQGPLND
jgi:reactive intermediate/imine deaminase